MKIKIHLQHDEMTTRSYSLLMNLINQIKKKSQIKNEGMNEMIRADELVNGANIRAVAPELVGNAGRQVCHD